MNQFNSTRFPVLKIVGIYTFFGSLWVYFSDAILGWFVKDSALITDVSLFKGMLFIALTAVLLYAFINRHVQKSDKTEELLLQSESRYRLLAENASDIIFTIDSNLNFTYISPSISRIRGYTVEEAMAQTPSQALTHDSLKVAMKAIQEELEIEERGTKSLFRTRTMELEETCKNGSTIWTETTFSLLRDEESNFRGFLGITRDITERKLSEETIRKSEEHYRTVFENTATANIIVAEDTTILLANSNFERLTGYSKQELENNMSFTSLVSGEDLNRVITYHKMRLINPEAVPGSYELRFVDRQGQVKDLFLSVAIIPETKDSVVSIIDITDWKRSEQAKSESEERFRELAELLPETVYEADKYAVFTFANKMAFDKFGYSKEDLSNGFSVFDMIEPVDHARMLATYQKITHGDQVALDEYLAKKKDGSTFPALIYATAIFRDGKPAGHRGFVIDISEKKNLESQLMRAQKMEAIGTLAGGIAHDFNNLLMGILGNISLIHMKLDKTNPIFERLKNMEDYVQRGSDLTKQLLGFARGGKYEVKATDLTDFIRESSELFGRTKKEIHIHRRTQEGLWTVEVDRGQMEQVMLNLYVNAWQAMSGGGDLYLSAENVDLNEVDVSPYNIRSGKYVKVTVQDTGIGMDENTKAHIFEPFFTTKERGRGTGLGLASAYGIIKNHGGFIHVESEKGIGTSFMIHLPASDKEIMEDHKPEDEIRKGHETILLIDDEDMILDVASKMLEGLGHTVMTAVGGVKGFQIYEQYKDRIDLVILDMIMPAFGGRETFETLLKIDPSVKVLLSSGYSLDGQAKEIIQNGCKGFIQKPFALRELATKIRAILG
jgi:two-component system, cell cycle sensor histidine kinase and response regulator CckA